MHTRNGKSTSIVPDGFELPHKGITCSHPSRVKFIAKNCLSHSRCISDVRGFCCYVGNFEGQEFFIINAGIGAGSSAIIYETLAVQSIETIVRLGTIDNMVTKSDEGNVFIVEKTFGLVGLMKDYGVPKSDWDCPVLASSKLTRLLKDELRTELSVISTAGYHVESYYSHLNPERFAVNPAEVRSMQKKYEKKGAAIRDMESGVLFFIANLRKFDAACVLMAVQKHGSGSNSSMEDTKKRSIQIARLILRALL